MSIPPLLVLTWLKDHHRIAIPARGSVRWSIHFDSENEALLRQISKRSSYKTLHLRVWDNKSRSDFLWASAENTLQPSIALWVLLYEALCLHDLSVTTIKSCLPLVMQNFHLYACEQCYRLQMADHGRKPKILHFKLS